MFASDSVSLPRLDNPRNPMQTFGWLEMPHFLNRISRCIPSEIGRMCFFSYYFSLQKGLPVSRDCPDLSVHRKMLPIQQKTDIIDKEQYRVLLEEEFCETPEGERMIVCNNCGASYADDAPRCPYCGGDNFEKSVQVHEDTINDLKREKQQWEEKPQRVAKAGMSMVAKVLITVIVAGLLISAGIYVAMRIHTVASDNRGQYSKSWRRCISSRTTAESVLI